jgi:hypothetical protein
LVTIISVSPIMALSGVRSSWLMLARNCELRSLPAHELRALANKHRLPFNHSVNVGVYLRRRDLPAWLEVIRKRCAPRREHEGEIAFPGEP